MNDNMERLLTVCDVSVVCVNVMNNKWRAMSFQQWNCYGNEEVYERECAPDDKLFWSEIARWTFESFTGRGYIIEQATSIMPLIRADSWITAVMQDVSRKLAGIRKGVRERFLVRNRYWSLWPIAVGNLQIYILHIMEKSLEKGSKEHGKFLKIRIGYVWWQIRGK